MRSSDNVTNQVGASAVDDDYAVWSEIDWSLGPDQGIRIQDLSTGDQRWLAGPSAGSMAYPAVSGDVAVWSQEDIGDGGYDVYACDMASGEAPYAIATGLSIMPRPAIDGDLVVWASPGCIVSGYNLATQKGFSIDPGLPTGSMLDNVAISGTNVVWSQAISTDWDICGYDLSTDDLFNVCTATGDQTDPAISGDVVVWLDGRAGRQDAPDVYEEDLSTGVESAICTDPTEKDGLGISGHVVVWGDGDDRQIHGYDLTTATGFLVSSGTNVTHEEPAVGGDNVIWTDESGSVGPDLYMSTLDFWQAGISIQDGSPWTNSADVTVAPSCEPWSSSATAMRFSVDGSTWTDWLPYADSQALVLQAGDGPKTVSAQYEDAVGGISTVASSSILLDTLAPSTSDDADAAWHSSDVAVALTPSDSGSGVKATYYQVDGGPQQTGVSVSVLAPSDHSNDGIHTVRYWSEDQAGNIEGTESCHVKIDTTAPVTTDSASGGWLTGPTTVTLTPSDAASGVKTTAYCLDDGLWQNGTSVQVLDDGVHTIAYASTDNAGNVEQTKTCQVKIDSHAPITTVAGNDAAWHRKPVTLTFAATDVGPSGVKQTQFRLDSQKWTTGQTLTVPAPANHKGDGVHTIYYRSTDNAGNVEATRILHGDDRHARSHLHRLSLIASGRRCQCHSPLSGQRCLQSHRRRHDRGQVGGRQDREDNQTGQQANWAKAHYEIRL